MLTIGMLHMRSSSDGLNSFACKMIPSNFQDFSRDHSSGKSSALSGFTGREVSSQ
jgi:hypothetical protein